MEALSLCDIMGLSLARKSGMVLALISGEASPLVDRLASKLGIGDVYKNCKDKASALRTFSKSTDCIAEICFIGDDVNDLPALSIAGLSACPATRVLGFESFARWSPNSPRQRRCARGCGHVASRLPKRRQNRFARRA